MNKILKRKFHKRLAAGLAATFVLGLPLLAWVMGMRGSAFLYRNGFDLFIWRFALTGLVAWGVMGLITNPRRGKVLAILSISVFLLIFNQFFWLLQSYCGIVPAIQYDAPGVLLPFVLALAVVLAPHRIVCCAHHQRARLTGRFFVTSLLTGATLAAFSFVIFLTAPISYTWYAEYLSQKYQIPLHSTDEGKLANLKAEPIPNPPPPPLGLVAKYFIFGERAIDYSALND